MHNNIAAIAQRRGVRQFFKFGIVGLSGFIVNFIVFTVLHDLIGTRETGFEYDVIFSIAFMTGGVSNYFLNRIWTFRSTGHAVKEGAQFLTVSAAALVVSLIVTTLVSPYLGHGHKTWFVANVAGIFINFFLNKFWTFKHVS